MEACNSILLCAVTWICVDTCSRVRSDTDSLTVSWCFTRMILCRKTCVRVNKNNMCMQYTKGFGLCKSIWSMQPIDLCAARAMYACPSSYMLARTLKKKLYIYIYTNVCKKEQYILSMVYVFECVCEAHLSTCDYIQHRQTIIDVMWLTCICPCARYRTYVCWIVLFSFCAVAVIVLLFILYLYNYNVHGMDVDYLDR